MNNIIIMAMLPALLPGIINLIILLIFLKKKIPGLIVLVISDVFSLCITVLSIHNIYSQTHNNTHSYIGSQINLGLLGLVPTVLSLCGIYILLKNYPSKIQEEIAIDKVV